MKNSEFAHLQDNSIPDTPELLEEELLRLDNIGREKRSKADDARYNLLASVESVLESRDDISRDDLRGMTPQEIDDLSSVVTLEMETSISELTNILGRSRGKVRGIILFKVLGVTKEDLK